jgi:hypothetical protein
VEHKKIAGLLQPLPVPEWKWEEVTMDFVTGLPLSQTKKDAIWVVVDRLTKSAHFIPVNVKDSMEKLTRIYTQEVVRLHGVPSSIVSDRDPRFTSRFWQKFQESMGTSLKFSTTAHPQTDGQSERVIQILEDMLRACVLDFGDQWIGSLPYAELAYNNSYQTSIGMAPYEALYGRKCQVPLYWGWTEDGHISKSGEVCIQEMTDQVKLIRERLKAAQSRQKSYADNRRRDLEFQVGERVFLKLTPSRGILRHPKGGKLSPRYLGPFPILERIGPVAYRLDLPDGLIGIHDVFHVSQLKKYRPDAEHVLNEEPLLLQPNLSYVEKPVKIIEKSVKELRSKKIPMVKILWEHHGARDATWETEEWVRRKYPELL